MAEFFAKYDVKTADEDPGVLQLAEDLLNEEFLEREEALQDLHRATPGNDEWYEALAHYGAESADLIYVICYDAYARGVNLAPILDAIHEANLNKVWDDGKIHRNRAGKVLKPSTWRKPDFRAILMEQLETARLAA